MLRVAVTGAAGYIGGRLIRRLEADDAVESILALDIAEPARRPRSEKTRFMRLDVAQPFPNLFRERGINAVVHLAYVLAPGRNPEAARMVNAGGALNMLEACDNVEIQHILYLSSASIYGARPGNPEFFTESHRPNPVRGFQYSEDKLIAESFLSGFANREPSIPVAVLRACPVAGPNADNFIADAFRKPILPMLGDNDPEMQFIHEDDLTDAMARCLKTRTGGVYNVAADGAVRWSRVAEMMGRRTLRLPPSVWRGLASASWRLRLQSVSPPAGLDFITHRWAVDASKIKRTLDIQFRHTSCEAWRSYARKGGEQ